MIRSDNDVKSWKLSLCLLLIFSAACAGPATPTSYHAPNTDFAALQTIAVLPFANLTTDRLAAERVRDTFANSLLSTGVIYVLPSGEVEAGISRSGVRNSTAPSPGEIAKIASVLNADAVITGVVKEYGSVRSGATSANIISLSLQMIEGRSGRVMWSASSTKGGIGTLDRLFGGGGKPMNDVTKAAVDDLIAKLFE